MDEMAIDDCHTFIQGFDESNGEGNHRWRIEKRDLTTGEL